MPRGLAIIVRDLSRGPETSDDQRGEAEQPDRSEPGMTRILGDGMNGPACDGGHA